MRKLTVGYIKKEFEKEGAVLLSDTYVNSKTPLKYICLNGHNNTTRWNNWQQGKKCSICSRNKKLNKNFISDELIKEGYKLLSDKYVNARSKFKYMCSFGHVHEIDWNHWVRGKRCPYCAGNARLDIEKVKKDFEKENYILISKKYTNAVSKLIYICDNNHVGSISWAHWQQGNRCVKCYDLKRFGENNPSWKGGISFEPYCEVWKDKEYKEDIKERDGNKCLNSYCSSKNPNDLVIHHIDYNKKNCSPENLITVCRACNGSANKERNWHKAWYQAIIKNRYNYGRIN